MSIALSTAVYYTGVHDSDVAWYTVYEDGAVLDQFCSNPTYFTGDTTPDDAASNRTDGSPEVLLRFAKAKVTVKDIEAAMHDRDIFAETTLTRIAKLFGIDPECTLASSRYLDGDNPTVGDRNVKRVGAVPPLPKQASSDLKDAVRYVDLFANPAGAEVWSRADSVDYISKRLDWSAADCNRVAEYLADYAPAVKVVTEIACETPTRPAKMTLSILTRTKWRQDGRLDRAGEMAIEVAARRIADRLSKNLVSHKLAYLKCLAYYTSPFPAAIVPDASGWETALGPFYRYGVLTTLDENIVFDPFLQQAMRLRVISGRAPSDGLCSAVQFVDMAVQNKRHGVLLSVEAVLGYMAASESDIVVWLTRPGDAVAKSLRRSAGLAGRVSRHYVSKNDFPRAIHYCRLRAKFIELRYGVEHNAHISALNDLAELTKKTDV